MSKFLYLVLATVVVSVLAVVIALRYSKTVVHDWQWGLLYKLGRFQRVLKPGAYWWVTPLHEIIFLDKRRQTEIIPGQEVLTKDTLGVKLSLVVEYRFAEPHLAMSEVEDVTTHLHSVAQIAIRKAAGERDLDILLNEREVVAEEVHAATSAAMTPLGVEVVATSLRDIMLSKELRSGYAAVVTARKEGEANLERARGETAALRHLANAAQMVKNNPDLMQLRLIQSMTATEAARRTFVIGVPPSSAEAVDRAAEQEDGASD
jgi:regulator of protease activity HflC (stomatin/prohibitin superfamily)